MQELPVMYWIPKMHKYAISFHLIISFPVGRIKPLSKDIPSTFKVL